MNIFKIIFNQNFCVSVFIKIGMICQTANIIEKFATTNIKKQRWWLRCKSSNTISKIFADCNSFKKTRLTNTINI